MNSLLLGSRTFPCLLLCFLTSTSMPQIKLPSCRLKNKIKEIFLHTMQLSHGTSCHTRFHDKNLPRLKKKIWANSYKEKIQQKLLAINSLKHKLMKIRRFFFFLKYHYLLGLSFTLLCIFAVGHCSKQESGADISLVWPIKNILLVLLSITLSWPLMITIFISPAICSWLSVFGIYFLFR